MLVGYELIADACRFQKDAEHLLIRFKIEELRLVNWAKTVQLDYTDERLLLNDMSRGWMIDILFQQQKLLASFSCVGTRYEHIRKPLFQEQAESFVIASDKLLENGSGMSEHSNQTVQFPVAEKLVTKALKWLNQSGNVPNRIRWAAWDGEKMEALIHNLSGYNDRMHSALDQAQVDTLHDMTTRTKYQIILLNEQSEQMVSIWQSERIVRRPQGMITDIEDSEYDFRNGITRSGTRSLTQPLGALAQHKFVHLAIKHPQYVSKERGESIGLPHLADQIRETEIYLHDIYTRCGEEFPDEVREGDRTEATYNGASVWIEWKPSEVAGPGIPDGQIDPKIRSRVQKLATLLKQNVCNVRFRVPHCLGYFVDESEDRESRFGLVFEKPPTVPPSTSPTTLRALIEASSKPIDIPSLTDRITLMRLLAGTVERLQAVDWSHMGFRSSNILFFKTQRDDGVCRVDLSNPYVSGFDHSRPATDDMTEGLTGNAWADVYRHPTMQTMSIKRGSYMKSFDLYSLGIVLLEIAQWKTIDRILEIDLDTASPKQTRLVMDRLLETESQHLKFVKSYLGNAVEQAVRACLGGPASLGLPKGCDEGTQIVAAELQKEFGERVVRRLAGVGGL